MFRVLIAGDVALYTAGLAQILSQQPDLEVAAITSDHAQTVVRAEEAEIDMVLIDMAMHDSERTVRALRELPRSPVLVALAVPETKQEVITVAEAGLSGYVARTATPDELVATIAAARKGELTLPPEIAASLFRRINALSSARSSLDDTTNVTGREMEIVSLIDRGLSNKEIACLLAIEVSTVKNHVHNLLEKVQVRRRGELAARLRHRLTRDPVGTAPRSIESDPAIRTDRKLA